MKPLIIGQAPGPSGNPTPLAGRCGGRLAALCGLDLRAFLTAFDRANVFATFPGKAGAGDAFPVEEARARADAMAEVVAARDHVVLLGWNVARAFRVSPVGYFEWTRLSRDCGEVTVAPHPSGLNRWWNVPHVDEARRFWTAFYAATAAPKADRNSAP